jgi:hypothetical protein
MDVNGGVHGKETGIQVNYTTFEDNESMYSKLAGGGAKLRRDHPRRTTWYRS